MAKNFDLLVFDWDGTLLDSTGAIVSAIKTACRDLGLSEPSTESARHIIGLGLRDALRLAVPDLSEERFPQMVERYRYHYLSCDPDLQLFDGIRALIAELKTAGYRLAIATGKSRMGLNRSLIQSDLMGYFSATRCADECFSKPHPQMLHELMDECAVVPERTLMIGDTTHDVQMAINAGVACVAVAYGAHPASALNALNPKALVSSVAALAEWLRSHT